MTYFGIDIGKHGAIVGTTAEKDPTWIFSEIPYQDGSLAIARLYFLLSKTIKRSDVVFLEQQFVNQKTIWQQGVFEGLLTSLGITYHLIHPRKWQNTLRLDKNKESHIAYVQTLGYSFEVTNKQLKHGVADAICVALAGKTLLTYANSHTVP